MMPKAKNPITDEERSRRFEEEIRKRKKAGDFDLGAAKAAVEALVRKNVKDGGRREGRA